MINQSFFQRAKRLYIALSIALMSVTIMGLAIFTSSANAQLVFEEQAKQRENQSELFYEQCSNFYIGIYKEETINSFCSCITAERYELVREKYAEDMGDFFDETREIRLDPIDYIANIQGPCLYVFAKDREFRNCAQNTHYDALIGPAGNKRNLCLCLALHVESYYKEVAQPYLQAAFQSSSAFLMLNDPVVAIALSREFKEDLKPARKQCLDAHADIQD